MTLSVEAKDELLALIASRSVTVGLFERDDDDGELVDPRYERLPVAFTAPETAGSGGVDGGGDLRFIENDVELRYSDMGRDHQVVAWGLFDAAGALVGRYPLLEPRELPAEDNAVFRRGSLRIGIP